MNNWIETEEDKKKKNINKFDFLFVCSSFPCFFEVPGFWESSDHMDIQKLTEF